MKGPWRVTLDTNPDDCNLKCIMCEEFSPFSDLKKLRMIEGNTPRKRRMNFSLIKKVMKNLSVYGELIELIPSTMGEPLLYRHFDKIIDLCKKYNVKMNLTTNGTFPGKTASEWAELIVPITSDVKISWNGVTKETQEKVMIKSNFDRHLQNLKDFIEVRDRIQVEKNVYCKVTLQVTFMEVNYKEFPDLVKLAASLGVDRIKGHHLWTHFDQIKKESMRRNRTSIQNWNAIVADMEIEVDNNRKPNGEKVFLDNIFKIDENSSNYLLKNSICPFLGKEVWIAWDGRFNPCCAPDKERRTLGNFGNINDISFSDIWEGQKYRDLVKNYDENDLCKGCNMRKVE